MSQVVVLPGAEDARLAATGVLLSRPQCSSVPECRTVYGLRRGRVGTAPLAAYYLPASRREDTAAMPGPVRPEGLAMLPLLAELAERMCPWVRVDVVPSILTHRGNDGFGANRAVWSAGGRDYSEAGGLALTHDGLILLALRAPDFMVDTLCHEIMHQVWWTALSMEARGVLEATVAQGPRWPGAYYGCPEEQVARMFAAWCLVRVGGMPSHDHDVSVLTAHGLFEQVWTGRMADAAIRRGLVTVSDEARAARGLLPPPAPPSPFLNRVAAAAWAWARERVAD